MRKRQACMNPQRPTAARYFPPKIAYRSPPVLLHSSRGVHHTTSSCAKKHRGERVPRYVVSRLFHRAIRASSHYLSWTHHLFICLLPFLTSSSFTIAP